jgi:REP element-mobilizing transposase RayT
MSKRPNYRVRYLAPWHLEEKEIPSPSIRKVLAKMRDLPAIYHCVTHANNVEQPFDAQDKETLVGILRQYARFSGVRLLAYCIMADHFHLLVEVPPRPTDTATWSDEAFLERLAIRYSGAEFEKIADQLAEARDAGDDEAAEAIRDKYFRRMWDISQFMKTAKQRFAQRFNRRYRRDGHLWYERYKSAIVEPGHAARMVAAYIDLHSVREEYVEDPKDYRWSSYAMAMVGDKDARAGIVQAIFGGEKSPDGETTAAKRTWTGALKIYQAYLFPEAAARRSDDEPGATPEEAELLRDWVPEFIEGRIVGSEDFVNRTFHLSRDYYFTKSTRLKGAIRFDDVETSLCFLRPLRGDGDEE